MRRDGDRDDEMPPPLAGFAAGLLAAERRRPAPAARVRRSVWRRTRGTLIASGLVAPLLLSKVSAAAWGTKIVAVALAGLATGGAVLGTVVLVQRWRPVPVVVQPAPIPPRAVVLDLTIAPDVLVAPDLPVAPNSLVVPDRQAARPAPAVAAPDRTGDLARERVLIDAARAALGARDHAGATRALARHARAFPAGVFVEERTAMSILLLAHTGEQARARVAAAAFLARYPGSVYRTRIDAAVEAR